MGRIKGFYRKEGKTRPITESKGETSYDGQTEDSTWKESSIGDLTKPTILLHSDGRREYIYPNRREIVYPSGYSEIVPHRKDESNIIGHGRFQEDKIYTFYHGSKSGEIKELRPGAYLATNEAFAENFALRDLEGDEKGTIYKVRVKGRDIGFFHDRDLSKKYNPEEDIQPDIETETETVNRIVRTPSRFKVVDPLGGGENWGFIVTQPLTVTKVRTVGYE